MPPIIFCHYGNTRYLRYSMSAAIRSNPDREVILLGDAANSWLGRYLPIRHIPFAEMEKGEELREFDRVYRAVQGPRHVPLKGGRDWLNFVFRRWFYILNYLRDTHTDAFWHFDSDTMLLRSLASSDRRFAAVACTEQCEGSCLNGWVSGPELVARYIASINEVFSRRAYLAEQQKEFDTISQNWAFTEMRAWAVFRDEHGVPTARLNSEHEGAVFDDCICHDHGFETDKLRHGQPVKRVWLGDHGTFWIRRRSDASVLRLNSLNLSWVPDYLFAQVADHLEGMNASNPGPEAMVGAPTLARRRVPLRFLLEQTQVCARFTVKRLMRRRVSWP